MGKDKLYDEWLNWNKSQNNPIINLTGNSYKVVNKLLSIEKELSALGDFTTMLLSVRKFLRETRNTREQSI